jgi:hypothetical protein
LGVSLVEPTYQFIKKIKRYPNAVVHTINGILTPTEALVLSNWNVKILILGYKHIRKGEDWYNKASDYIIRNQNWLKNNIMGIINWFSVISFDNLAIEQLDIKSHLSQKEWDKFYAGDDGEHTFYIDMVERKFAKSSTADFDKRYDLLDSVDEMFKIITEESE